MNETLTDYARYVNQGWIDTLGALGDSPIFIKAEGDLLYDDCGGIWYDFIGHYGATLFGHNYKPLIDSLKGSLDQKAPSGAPLGITKVASTLAKTIIQRLELKGAWKNWTLTSGSEAVESAIKLASFSTKKHKILARRNAFHGLSNFTLQLNDNEFWRSGFESLVGTGTVDYFNDTDEAIRLINTRKYSSLIIEPIQAIAGGKVITSNDAKRLRQSCSDSGTLFITDEVFSGMGRCGSYSAMQSLNWEVEPDIIILSKTLTGGLLPSAQLVVRQKIFDDFTTQPGKEKSLSSTFSGNSLGQTVALSVLSLLDEEYSKSCVDDEKQHFTRQLNELFNEYPQFLNNVASFTNVHFLRFESDQLAWTVWQYLYANKVLTTICAHKTDTLKLICSIQQSRESLELLCSVIKHVFEEVDYV